MKKKIILLFMLVVLYFLVSFVLNFIENQKKVVYIGVYTKIYIKNNKIEVKNKNDYIINKPVKVLLNDKYYDAYMNSNDADLYNAYNFFDKKKNKIQFNNDFIASTRNIYLKVENSSDYLYENIKNYDFGDLDLDFIDENYKTTKKYVFDIDGNGKKEVIYIISGNISENKIKTYFILESNNKYSIFKSYVLNMDSPAVKDISLYKFIDFNNDKKYEIVLRCNDREDLPPHFDIYSYKNNKLEK